VRRGVAIAVVIGIAVALSWLRSKQKPVQPRPQLQPAAAPAFRGPSARSFAQRLAVTLAQPADDQRTPERPSPSGAFEGRVVSALTGQGLPGAQLTFARSEETSSVTAAPDGSFHFDARVPGRWLLAAATAKGHEPFAPEWGQSPVQLDARPGEVVRGITVSLLPLQEYEGRVFYAQQGPGSSEERKPVEGAEVTVLGGGRGASALVPLETRLHTGADGSFRFTAPDEAVVEARKPGFAVARAEVDYTARLSHKLTLQLEPLSAPALSIEGIAVDASDAPLEGVAVSAARKDTVGDTAALARTGADGKFRIDDLAAGPWIVVANLPGLAPASVEAQAGATGVKLRLLQGGALEGHVRDHSGQPVKVFSVLAISTESRTMTEIKSISVIDGGGHYRMEGLAPGPTAVTVTAPGLAPATDRRVTIPETGTATLDFDLTAGGKLTGIVVDRTTQAAIASAEVAVEGSGATAGVPIRNETLTGPDGRFTLAALEEVPLGITASAFGHHARILSAAKIADGETAGPITIQLTPLAPGEDPRIELAGIGAVLSKRGDAILLGPVVPGGGAAEAGLGPGDAILAIEGAPTKEMTLGEAIPLLRGPEGTVVTLSVVKAGAGSAIVVAVPRRLVRT
jgi:hypothetical protein